MGVCRVGPCLPNSGYVKQPNVALLLAVQTVGLAAIQFHEVSRGLTEENTLLG